MHRTLRLLLPLVILCAIGRLGATGASGSGSVDLSTGAPMTQTFDSLSNSTSPSTALPTGWYLVETGSGAAADGAYVVGTGSSNAGGAYSFGVAASTDRALGSLGSGSVTPISYGVKLRNVGAGPITALAVSYNGEMWRRGPAANLDRLTFSYSTDATNLSTGTFTPLVSLDFASPGNACLTVTGQTNGNSAACRSSISATITGLGVNPGGTIWLRWTDTDTAGSDDGLAVDNVSVSATFSTAPTPPFASGSASPTPVNPGQSLLLSGTLLPGFNPLSQILTLTCDLQQIGGPAATVLPVSGTSFSYTTTVSTTAPLGPLTLPCTVSDELSRSTAFNIGVTVLLPLNDACGAQASPVSAVQGAGLLSAFAGLTVDVEAIVLGDFQATGGLAGFYIEEPDAEQDANPATSEGIFVFSATPVAVGDRVRVRGKVAEFASATGSAVSRLTEIANVTSVQVCHSAQALPSAVEVSLPIDDVSHWERYEGMLVQFSQPLVVTGNFNLGQFGQIDLAPAVLVQPTQHAGTSVSWAAAADLNARSRIALDDGSTLSRANLNGGTVAPYPPPGLSYANTLRVGALVNPPAGQSAAPPLVGILDDRFGSYRVQPTAPVFFSNDPNPRASTADVAAEAGARYRIVSANVLNFFVTLGSRGAATPEELDHQRAKLVAELSAAGGDVIALSELQNFENGQTNGGVYTNSAIADLTAALAAATGRTYRYIDTIDPAGLAPPNVVTDNGTDAIRSGMIYDAGSVTPIGRAALLMQNDQNRPTLAQTFQPAGGIHPERQTFTVVVNHFRSKGSACGPGNDDPLQGNCNGMRLSMAMHVVGWLGGNPTADPAGFNRRYILVGDFNSYYAEDPIQALVNSGYTNLIHELLGSGAYSYNFDSQVGYLDHALANAEALPLVKAVRQLHVNADEPRALQALNTSAKSAAANAAYYAPGEFAASDHDPVVIGFNPLLGDFNDDGVLDAQDRTALLLAIARGEGERSQGSLEHPFDRRMDMDGNGRLTQGDFLIWQRVFIAWQQKRK